MALFTFIAQPLFAIVAIGYPLKVTTDLRKRGLKRSRTSAHRVVVLPQNPFGFSGFDELDTRRTCELCQASQ